MTIVPEGFDPYLADALLLLAADEGQNLNSYARMSGASKSVMASYFMELSDRATTFCRAVIDDSGVTHERTASPSMWTVQAPHCASPQPKRGPCSARLSRSA